MGDPSCSEDGKIVDFMEQEWDTDCRTKPNPGTLLIVKKNLMSWEIGGYLRLAREDKTETKTKR